MKKPDFDLIKWCIYKTQFDEFLVAYYSIENDWRKRYLSPSLHFVIFKDSLSYAWLVQVTIKHFAYNLLDYSKFTCVSLAFIL